MFGWLLQFLWFGRCIFKTGLRCFSKAYKETLLHRIESFNRDNYVRQAATQMGLLAKWSEGDMIAREDCYHDHFANFSTIKKITLKTFRKFLKLLQLSKILCKVDSGEVAPFIKLSLILKFYCYWPEILKHRED